MTMYYKIYKRRSGFLLTVADENVIGKTLKGKDKSDFYVNPRFYKDKEGTNEEIIDLLQNCSNANLIGKECVELAIKGGFVDPKQIIKIQGVPHAQIVTMT